MKFTTVSTYCTCAVAALSTLVTGCGGLQTGGAASIPQQSAVGETTARREAVRSWMAPDAKGQDLLYVSEYGDGVIDVFSFPRGKFEGSLTGFSNPQGECVDKKGDVWIVSPNGGQPGAVEFAHGGTSPIGTVSDPNQDPYACSVDSKTNTLAVTNEESGSLALYANEGGSPKLIADPNMDLMLWCAYDDAGNLFVDGLNPSVEPEFDELPAGASTFTKITLNKSIGFPGNIQANGSHLALDDVQYEGQNTSAIYQLQLSGATATIVGTTQLTGSQEVFGTWIAGKRVVAPEDGSSQGRSTDAVKYWPYPGGGNAVKTLHNGGSDFFDGPFGAAVSPARRAG